MSMVTLVSARTKGKQLTLQGDWRRRRGTQTDAHLYEPTSNAMIVPEARLPACRKRIRYRDTVRMVQGKPCMACLVAEITRRDR